METISYLTTNGERKKIADLDARARIAELTGSSFDVDITKITQELSALKTRMSSAEQNITTNTQTLSSTTQTANTNKQNISTLTSDKQNKLKAGTGITIDQTTNTISADGGGSTITVDDALSTTSKNPVQNLIITNALSEKAKASHTHAADTDITGLSDVATSGDYNDLLNLPTPYSLPTASSSTLGGIKVGDGLTIQNDVLSVIGGGTSDQQQADWNEEDSSKVTYIKNKPAIVVNDITQNTAARHTHDNKSILDDIVEGTTEEPKYLTKWNAAYTYATEHPWTNWDIVKAISSDNITSWNSKAEGSHTHQATDLTIGTLTFTGGAEGVYDGKSNLTINIPTGGGSSYILPTASATVMGGVKIGQGLIIDATTGILSLKPATATALPSSTNAVATNTSYYLTDIQTAINFTLPTTAVAGDYVKVVWYNGDTAATYKITGNCLATDFQPQANSRSELYLEFDGSYWDVQGHTSVASTTASLMSAD